jgi:hypothetical protein
MSAAIANSHWINRKWAPPTPTKTSAASWDAFADVDAFVDAVLAELAGMAADGIRRTRSGPKASLSGAALRKAVMAIWCVAFCGMQWRAIGLLCDIPFGTLYTLFARWTRLGLWRRLLNRLILSWRQACGDKPVPTAVIIDSRSCQSAPTCFTRGFDGGKRSRASISILRSISTAFRWRSTFRRPTGMTARVSSHCCISLSAAVSKEQRWAISAIATNGCPRPAKCLASPSNPVPVTTAEPSFRKGFGGWSTSISHSASQRFRIVGNVPR